MRPPNRPLRVAVVGGGCAALTTAFELTKPVHGGRYAVTVYQMGWRLGGKGASGRGVGGRIEEHGLHLWMGFYENAFRLMREAYAEAARDPRTCPVTDWRDAFVPAPDVAVADRSPNGDWRYWMAHFPPGRGLPGDPLERANPFTVLGYLQQAVDLVGELLRSAQARTAAPPVAGPRFAPARPTADELLESIDRVVKYGQLATIAVVHELADLLRGAMEALFPHSYRAGGTQSALLGLVDAIAALARRQLDTVASADPELARLWQVVDLILAILRGSIRFGLAFDPRGFDAIDEYDWRDWLRLNGASEPALDSGFMRGIYDLAFAFERGDVTRPALAAGVALRGAMRMFFTYRGSLFWRMEGGMGDIVFSPLYEVLKKRGVRFEFFHRLTDVRLGGSGAGERPHVAALDFDVQATVQGGGEYRPLVDVRGLPCWPSEPDWSQLEGGEAMRAEGRELEAHWDRRRAGAKTLEVGEHFDFVVLGVALGAVPHVARELVEHDPKWRAMVENVRTVPTQALQLWLRADRAELGWNEPAVNLSGFVEPFDTWADMTHLVPREGWRVPPRSIAYFCSVLPDAYGPGAPDAAACARAYADVRANAVRFLDRDLGALWPSAVDRSGFRWELLNDEGEAGLSPPPREGHERIDAQFWKANVNPSDRYVLSVPGSSRHRISPLDMTFDNLTIAGDWTDSGLNTGCVESAVMSGLLAAHALSHEPALEDIVGYDHP